MSGSSKNRNDSKAAKGNVAEKKFSSSHIGHLGSLLGPSFFQAA